MAEQLSRIENSLGRIEATLGAFKETSARHEIHIETLTERLISLELSRARLVGRSKGACWVIGVATTVGAIAAKAKDLF